MQKNRNRLTRHYKHCKKGPEVVYLLSSETAHTVLSQFQRPLEKDVYEFLNFCKHMFIGKCGIRNRKDQPVSL